MQVRSLLLASAMSFAMASAALAQTPQVPMVQNVGPADVFQDVVGGVPQANSYYALATQIDHVYSFVQTVPVTAFSLTFANNQSYFVLTPAGTLATGTITFEPSPANGARECVISSQTQTALTLQGNTGQTVSNPVTALVAQTAVCYMFNAANATWYKS